MITDSEKIEIFERSFSSGSSGCVRTCNCGQEFYNASDRGCWEEGELEGLQNDPKAKAVDYSISTVVFEGGEYCVDCDCWKKRALKIIRFIESHGQLIASYFNERKKRESEAAAGLPSLKQ